MRNHLHAVAARSRIPRRLGARLAVVAVWVVTACSGGGDPTSPSPPPPPPPPPPPSLGNDPPTLAREFRGLWVATVANIDWPTQPGLSQTAQLDEMRVILDRAQTLRMNAVIVQVRAAGDAIYPSAKEPWSRVLTGTQGIAPGTDPLALWITEAHQRGLEFHAWFNPFRAGNVSDTSRLAPNHLARARPDLARIAQGQLWFDPGEPEVQQWTLDVILDVVSRYDIDAVHLDDYFYPYPLAGAPRPVQFPDDASYQKYRAAGGADVPRDDWRRQNINNFVQRLYEAVHELKPSMRVGISPFGIWRPGNPPGITGLDAYADIFADSRQWLENGWLDYFAPQLYWPLSSTGQNFSALFDWWLSVNGERRHVWPGLAAYRVADGTSSAYFASEIVAEIAHLRARAGPLAGGGSGALLYNTTSVRLNRGGLADALGTSSFALPALVPPFSWLDSFPPSTPSLTVSSNGSAIRAIWTSNEPEPARWWLLQWRTSTAWNARLIWGGTGLYDIPFTSSANRPDVLALTAFDQAMNASAPVIWRATP
jgi:uncharacterized lipoprotein YddW (UPF0748 family)